MSSKVLKSEINKDEKLQRFKKIFEEKDFNIDFADINDEIDTLMHSRLVRTYNSRKIESVRRAMTQDQANRTRFVEILMSLTDAEKFIENSVKRMTDYLMEKFYFKIKSIYTTKADRENFVRSVLKEYTLYLDKIEIVKIKCKYAIEDIDKSGYVFTNLVHLSVSAQRSYAQ